MTNTVLIKRSSTANAVPVAGNLVAGELAINFTDGNLFYKNAGNVVTVIASNQFSSVTGNVTGGNILTGGVISSVGTITGSSHLGAVVSVTANITGGNVLTAGQVSATGNVTGNFFIGNGSQLTGIVTSAGSSIVNGTSNVVVAASGNVTVSVGGTGNVAVFATSGEYVTGLISASGNVTGSNLLTGGVLSAVGNVTGDYIFGNGSQLTGISSGGNLLVVGRIATYFVPIFFGILNIIGRTGNIAVTISA